MFEPFPPVCVEADEIPPERKKFANLTLRTRTSLSKNLPL
jgi:hypothetical protein